MGHHFAVSESSHAALRPAKIYYEYECSSARGRAPISIEEESCREKRCFHRVDPRHHGDTVRVWVFHTTGGEAEYTASQESGPAPTGTVSERREWGKRRLRGFFEDADRWVRKSNQIKNNIGEITSVAPIGAPNSYGISFGEAWASLNLEVIGTRGEGVLLLPQAKPNEKAKWIFDGHAYRVSESGESWLSENGFMKEYLSIIEMDKQQNHADVISACEQLKHQADKDFEGVTVLNSSRVPLLFARLPMPYRVQVLKSLATSLVATDDQRNEMGVTALDVSVEAAEVLLSHLLEQQTRDEFPISRLQTTVELQQANEFLILATKIAPKSSYLRDLASIRALMAYRLQCGCFLRSYSGREPAEEQMLKREKLKGMYTYAKNLAERSPYLRRRLGKMRIAPQNGICGLPQTIRKNWSGLPVRLQQQLPRNIVAEYCEMRLDNDGRFGSYVGLNLVGKTGITGTLFLFVIEHVDQANQRDLFSERVTGPDGRFQHSEIRWDETDRRSKNLSSVTLEPLPRKKTKQ